MRKLDITFSGNEYTVSPEFKVIERIEQKFDLMSFLRSIQMARAKTRDIAWVLYCALNEAGYKDAYSDIGQAVLDDLESTTVAAAELVSVALGAGPESQPKKKSTEKKPDATT